jgi:DHA1 family bicyclomycin/chloramphenicol resistance-like MFS transporter
VLERAPRANLAPGKKPPIALLVSFGIIGPLTIHLVLPSLPHLQQDFDTDYATIQLLISLYIMAFGSAQLFIGPLADMIGRRRTLLAGISLYAVASALCALAPNVETLIALRMLQGVGGCTGAVLARAIVRDYYDDGQSAKVLGYLAMGIAIGPLVGPVAGGALFEITGWQGLFWLLAAIGTMSLVLGWLFVGNSGVRPGGSGRLAKLFADIGTLVRNRRFILSTLNICFNTGMFYAFIVGGPYIGNTFLGLSPKAYGAWFAVIAVGYAFGNFLGGRLIGRFALQKVVLAGAVATFLSTCALGAVFALHVASPLLVFGGVGLATLWSGLVMPNSLAVALSVDPRLAGSASGFAGFSQFAVAAAFSTVAGTVLERWNDPLAVGIVMIVATLASVIVSLLLLRR